mmetsp:Transcript_20756/g.30672  ORF Transcript_20756/g.30672 Transcript_20756/m.30672 type:complete len:284 (+) Transcript_20756:185-1036(+)
MSSPQTPSTIFTHQFSGYSVWLSPTLSKSQPIIQEMSKIAKACGGEARGVYGFEPHCTMLYNFDPNNLLKEEYSKDAKLDPMYVAGMANDKIDNAMHNTKIGTAYDPLNLSKQKVAKALLKKCKHLWQQQSKSSFNDDNSNGISALSLLKPESFYFFPYPKEADNGKGFGCVIPLLLLETTSLLQSLHDIVCNVFPPDERHRKELEKRDEIPNEGKFIPHMALCYAPEIYHDELEKYVNTLKSTRNDLLGCLETGFLSVWSTDGGLADWTLIARIELEEPLGA